MEPTFAFAAVLIISEIMYDPASDERWPARTEWVEVYNPGDQTVSMQGWYLANENGRTEPIEAEVTLDPGEAVVLIPGNQSVENFREAWGEGFDVVPLDGWHKPGLHQLTNTPDAEQAGVLTLHREDESPSDMVNWDNEDPWPPNKPDGPSIYVLPEHLDRFSNTQGENWVRSEAGVHGARHAEATEDYSAEDVGSPGVVITPADLEAAEENDKADDDEADDEAGDDEAGDAHADEDEGGDATDAARPAGEANNGT